jgi:hypothetical protein
MDDVMEEAYRLMAEEAKQEKTQGRSREQPRGGAEPDVSSTVVFVPEQAFVQVFADWQNKGLTMGRVRAQEEVVAPPDPLEPYHEYNRTNSRLATIWEFIQNLRGGGELPG